LSTEQALELLSYYHAEHSAPVWDTIGMVLADIRRVFDEEDLIESMKPYLRRITADQVERLGWEEKKGEPYFDSLLRPTVLGLASLGKNEAVVHEALSRFNRMKKSEDERPDLRGVIYGTAVRNGGQKEFAKLKKFYEKTTSATEKVTLASSLCAFKQPELYNEALSIIKSPLVRAQDISYWVAYSFSNRHAKRAAWRWMKQNWDWLEKNLGAELGFARLPAYAARSFARGEFKAEFSEFFEPRLTPAVAREYRKGLETIDWQTAWRDRDMATIRSFFKEFKSQ
jgi:puromycin-sensitive aminopeptidase